MITIWTVISIWKNIRFNLLSLWSNMNFWKFKRCFRSKLNCLSFAFIASFALLPIFRLFMWRVYCFQMTILLLLKRFLDTLILFKSHFSSWYLPASHFSINLEQTSLGLNSRLLNCLTFTILRSSCYCRLPNYAFINWFCFC